MPSSHHRHRQDKTVLSCLCRRCELNWRQDKTVFSIRQYIWDWTVLLSPVFRDRTKLQKTEHVRFRNFLSPTVLTCLQFNSRRHRQDKTVLSLSVLSVWSMHEKLAVRSTHNYNDTRCFYRSQTTPVTCAETVYWDNRCRNRMHIHRMVQCSGVRLTILQHLI